MANISKADKEERAIKAREAANGYRQSLAAVAAAEKALSEAHKAQTPFIEQLVELKGNSVKIKLPSGKEVMAKFRKDRDGGYLVSHEPLDGEAL